MPEGGAQLQRVLGRSPRRGPTVGHQSGDGLVELLGLECWSELYDAFGFYRSEVSFRMTHAGRHHDRLTGGGHEFLTIYGEVGNASRDCELLLLVRLDVLR